MYPGSIVRTPTVKQACVLLIYNRGTTVFYTMYILRNSAGLSWKQLSRLLSHFYVIPAWVCFHHSKKGWCFTPFSTYTTPQKLRRTDGPNFCEGIDNGPIYLIEQLNYVKKKLEKKKNPGFCSRAKKTSIICLALKLVHLPFFNKLFYSVIKPLVKANSAFQTSLGFTTNLSFGV